MKAIEVKKQLVEEIKNNIHNATSIVFVDYKGINVAEDTKLRKQCTETGVTYKVYKNRLLVRALNECGITDFDPTMLEGTTSVAFANDEVSAAKVICNTISDIKKMDVKFGYVNGKLASKQEIEALSKIPTKEVLVAMLLGVLQGPVSSLARALNEIAKKGN
ncbi:MAG TPA: 50S ribosomal protein L10 [Clostridiales bacterium]|nr:50S ribosomal protein L10 [Clostridiales bacterium]